MDDAMKIRDLNFKVTCLQNGLRIEKGQALVAYKENNDLKIEVDRLKTELQAHTDAGLDFWQIAEDGRDKTK
jgi:hypothetical protein